MTTALLAEREEGLASFPTRRLSFSRINRYLRCPEQYRCYYIEMLRLRVTPASLIFGQIVHQALAGFFLGQGDPVGFFIHNWKEAQKTPMAFAYRESWEKLAERGQALLELFLKEEVAKLEKVVAVEKAFSLSITSLDMPLVGIIDLVAEVSGERTVIDFKTASKAYEDYEVILSDQLTSYHLAEPDVRRSALCVLVKTKEPRIDWYFSQRQGEQLAEFLTKAEMIAQDITACRFYKRPGQWCAWCDYLPLCLGDRERAQQTLVQAP